ncbi:MAG: hypothetical protein JSV32_00425 [Dehalococcoidia bacterium]|nr:MAG: hypothetical protein JSV32_00425 [Dehalococcoidia bacterium]
MHAITEKLEPAIEQEEDQKPERNTDLVELAEKLIYDYIQPEKEQRVKIAPIGERNFRVNVYSPVKLENCTIGVFKITASYFFGLTEDTKLKVMAENKYT